MSAVASAPLAKTVVRPTPHSGPLSVAVFPGNKQGDPDITALVKTTPQGIVRSTMVRVPLNEAKGEVFEMGRWDPKAGNDGAWVKDKSITAMGYHRMNQFGGVSFATPENVIGEDSRTHGNPYFHRTEAGELDYVKVRRIGAGRNAIGNLIVIDLTVTYSLRMYLAQDVFSKWSGKKKDLAPKAWGEWFSTAEMPDAIRKDPKKWKVDLGEGSTLVLDMNHRDVIALKLEHINRLKFAERNAITICERNILKKFFAAAKLDPSCTVPVVSWQQQDLDVNQIGRVVQAASEGRMDLQEVAGERVEIQRESEIVADQDDIEAALHGDVDEDGPRDEPEQGEGPPQQDAPHPDPTADQKALADVKAKLRDNYTWLCQNDGAEAATTAIEQHGLSFADVGACVDPDLLNKANRSLEDARLKHLQARKQEQGAASQQQQAKGQQAANQQQQDLIDTKGKKSGDAFKR